MTGVNVTLSDGISTDIQLSTVNYLIGENPGQAGIRIGDTTYDLSFDVVTDDVWSFALTAPVDNGSGPFWSINALLADGTLERVGDACQITVTDAAGAQLVSSTDVCYVQAQAGHGQVCITIRNKSGCVSY